MGQLNQDQFYTPAHIDVIDFFDFQRMRARCFAGGRWLPMAFPLSWPSADLAGYLKNTSNSYRCSPRSVASLSLSVFRRHSSSSPLAASAPRVILSGIQPTGNLHIGNYLGAIVNWVDLQNSEMVSSSSLPVSSRSTVLFSVVDLHAITVPQTPPGILRENCLTMTSALLACGIDPKKSDVFIQSHVPGHSELAWLLGTLTPLGFLNRMTQYKDKTAKGNKDLQRLGLYSYPVLMTADILLYRATHVPVGDDQMQHLELAREIARMFNSQYGGERGRGEEPGQGGEGREHMIFSGHEKHNHGDTNAMLVDGVVGNGGFFPLPLPVFTSATRVMSLRDGTSKMSKSDPSPMTRIDLMDSDDDIRRKIAKAKTDSIEGVTYTTDHAVSVSSSSSSSLSPSAPSSSSSSVSLLSSRPEVHNLVRMYAALHNAHVKRGGKSVPSGAYAPASPASSSPFSSSSSSRPPPSSVLLPEDVPGLFYGRSLKDFKAELADLCIAHIRPVREEMTRLRKEEAYLLAVLQQGAEKAHAIADENVKKTRKLMGFL